MHAHFADSGVMKGVEGRTCSLPANSNCLLSGKGHILYSYVYIERTNVEDAGLHVGGNVKRSSQHLASCGGAPLQRPRLHVDECGSRLFGQRLIRANYSR